MSVDVFLRFAVVLVCGCLSYVVSAGTQVTLSRMDVFAIVFDGVARYACIHICIKCVAIHGCAGYAAVDKVKLLCWKRARQ